MIDNQTQDRVLVSVYIDGEGFDHLKGSQFINFSESVDFKDVYPVTRGNHQVLVQTISPDFSYYCNVSIGVWPHTTRIELRLTEDSLTRA